MQEDIAGIGRHQGRHGKYATFYVKRKMSEDFRSKPLVRMKCPVTVPDGAALYLCIMEKYWGFGKTQFMQEATRKFRHRSNRRMSYPPAKRKGLFRCPAMHQGEGNESNRRLHRGSRKSQACRDVVPKGRFTLGLAERVNLTEKRGSNGQGVDVLWK